MIGRGSLVLLFVLGPGAFAPGCHSERAASCQRLRQCCAVAAQSGEIEEVRVACTRLDDDQGTLCERRLAQVVAAMPKLAEEAQCRWP